MKKTILFTVAAFAIIATFLVGCEGQSGLSTPSNFKAYQEGNTIVLSWNQVGGASYYEINKNGSYWQSTSETRIVDKSPKEGINSYELIASNGDKQSKPAKASCDFESSGSGGGGGEQTTTEFYIKHPWGSGSDASWSWEPMKKSGNSYTYTGLWGGVGANINTSADDSGAEWYPASSISGASSLSVGTQVTFTFVSTNGNKGTLSVSTSTGGGSETSSLPAPTGFKVSQTSSYIQLSWNSVSGAVGYYIAKATENSEWEYYKTSYTSVQFDDVTVGTTYIFSVAAYDSDENPGEWSEDKYITFNGSSSGGGGGSTTSKPGTPTGVTATAASSYIVVTWNSVSGAESYNVYRSTSASGTYTFQSSVTTTNYTDYNVDAGTTYYYKVEAENSAGKSSKSSYASAKIATSGGGGGGTTNYEPCPPSVTCSGSSSVTIKWTASTGYGCGTPTSYDVKRTNLITGQAETLKSGTTSTSYTDSQPFPGKNKYGIIASNSYGQSSAGYGISSEVGINAPSIRNMLGSSTDLRCTFYTLNVPADWEPYYTLELHVSSSYSGPYSLLSSKSYDELDCFAGECLYVHPWGVNISGKTYYYKMRWVFDAPHSVNRVEGSFSSIYTIKH
ncbi:MAG: fibronectin type III domain-containing protein [Paludibacteraceae bacterium]|nr:fibronectin type III domain-containing protein [Paludibacteraceae bacterium]